ncbi:MAG: hypothetical protein LBI89_01455 [Prevotellaceae bacterium]|jgi:hypothetical protein|nr:hypothetical protein [Prevotellaceae bacterium]
MIRTVFVPTENNIVLNIPQEYIGKELEVIAFPVETALSVKRPVAKKKVVFTDFGIDAPDYKFNREEANAR